MNYKFGQISTFLIAIFSAVYIFSQSKHPGEALTINDEGYYDIPGLNIMVFNDFYPEGHQGGLTIVQFGNRVAANGDVRLEPTPGQWSPTPKVEERKVDKDKGIILVKLSYPDSSKDEKGFNPIDYPDLNFGYTIRTEAEGQSIKVIIDLDNPLNDKWNNQIGFNLELFPGQYFGAHYLMDGKSGMFPQQANGPMEIDKEGNLQTAPLAIGKNLIVAPGNKRKEIKFESSKSNLQLIDGRGLFNNGWFVLRSTIPSGVTKDAVVWIISPAADTSWRYKPVIQISQAGYYPKQSKFAVIELDKLAGKYDPIELIKINEDSSKIVKEDNNPNLWGNFLRYKYLRFDFSDIIQEGLYKIKYGNVESNEFEIKRNVYSRHIWQPTLEYFLPVQMCHMRVEDKYRVWHGLCHMDDATMAPVSHDHFDGYSQGPSTLTKYKSGEHVPGLNIGGWHDAGDYDLRVESQAGTVYKLSLAYELFKEDYDQTSINQQTRFVEIHQPDGKPDILQQIEHGLISIVGGYESLSRLYRGIQDATLHQYVLLGEAANATDNFIFKKGEKDPILNSPLPNDDRMVFTEINPKRELYVAQVLAAAYRVMKTFNPDLSAKCLEIAQQLYKNNPTADANNKINTAAELYLSTSNKEYEKFLLDNGNLIANNILPYGIVIGRVVKKIDNKEFAGKIKKAVEAAYQKISELQKENPYGVPYKPYIWGAGWQIQSFGVTQLLLHIGFPKIFSAKYAFNALNFILGCHPGDNTASFASGVGANSLIVAYGFNRADWTYIPGGVSSGTALIRPDLPELKTWPFFWQQTEYVTGGGATDFMLLAMAADHLFNN
jgi:endoglucanase